MRGAEERKEAKENVSFSFSRLFALPFVILIFRFLSQYAAMRSTLDRSSSRGTSAAGFTKAAAAVASPLPPHLSLFPVIVFVPFFMAIAPSPGDALFISNLE